MNTSSEAKLMNPLFLNRDICPMRETPNIEEINPNRGTHNHGDRFDEWDDEKVITYLTLNGFTNLKKLEDGSWCGLYRLAFTWSVCTDITYLTPYAYRWCFKDKAEADYFLENLKEFDEVPVKRTSLVGHRFSGEARLMAFDNLGLKKW